MIRVWIDGLCEPTNPGGIACYGVIIEGHTQFKGCVGQGPKMSNNVAEYAGLYYALQWLIEHGCTDDEVIIHSDSRLLVNQMSGKWSVRGGLYVVWYINASTLASKFCDIHYVWIPREQNKEADALSRSAYEEYCKTRGLPVEYMRQHPKLQRMTCLTCKWMQIRGPHIGCFYGGTWQKWLPKKFARTSRCEKYESYSSR